MTINRELANAMIAGASPAVASALGTGTNTGGSLSGSGSSPGPRPEGFTSGPDDDDNGNGFSYDPEDDEESDPFPTAQTDSAPSTPPDPPTPPRAGVRKKLAGGIEVIPGVSATRFPRDVTKDLQEVLKRRTALFSRGNNLVEVDDFGAMLDVSKDRLLSIVEDLAVIGDPQNVSHKKGGHSDDDDDDGADDEEDDKKKPMKRGKKGVSWRRPTRDDISVLIGSAKEWAPPLKGIIRCPYVRSDGEVVSMDGYDPATGLFAHHPHVEMKFTLEESLGIFRQLLSCWHFVSKEDYAHAFALLMLPVLRPTIIGPTPMHILSAGAAGKGKSALGEVCGALAGTTKVLTPSAWVSEAQRQLVEALRGEPDALILDNVDGTFVSADNTSLMSYVTSGETGMRGKVGSGESTVTVKCIWVLTSINIEHKLSLEMASRSLIIRSEGCDIPSWTDGLLLKTHVLNYREAYLSAALCIAQAAMKLPDPVGPVRVHPRAPQWSKVMNKVMVAVGLEKHFMLRRAKSTDDEETKTLFDYWPVDDVGSYQLLGARRVAELATEHDLQMWTANLNNRDLSKLGAALKSLVISGRHIGSGDFARHLVKEESRKGSVYRPEYISAKTRSDAGQRKAEDCPVDAPDAAATLDRAPLLGGEPSGPTSSSPPPPPPAEPSVPRPIFLVLDDEE